MNALPFLIGFLSLSCTFHMRILRVEIHRIRTGDDWPAGDAKGGRERWRIEVKCHNTRKRRLSHSQRGGNREIDVSLSTTVVISGRWQRLHKYVYSPSSVCASVHTYFNAKKESISLPIRAIFNFYTTPIRLRVYACLHVSRVQFIERSGQE